MLSQTEASFRRLLPLLRPYLRQLMLGGGCTVIYVACWPILAWLAGRLIPSIGAGELNKVIQVISIALIVFFIQKFCQFLQDTLLAEPSLRVSEDLRKELFSQLQNIELEALEKMSSGDLTYRLTEDADRVGEVIYKTIQDTTPCLLQLIAVFGYMIFLDWQLSLATIILAPIVALLVSFFGSKVMLAAERSQKQVSELAGLLAEAIQGLPLVRAFAAEEWLQKRFDKEVLLHRQARYKTLNLLALQHPVVGLIEAIGILSVLTVGAARIQTGNLDGQGFSSYVAALLMLIDPISHLTINFNEFKQGQASLRRLREIQNNPREQQDSPNAKNLSNIKGSLNFRNVSFSYNEGNKVIKNLNLNIEAGKLIALVGPSGAGKSTIFSLLLRFISPQEGEILIDSNKLSNLKACDIRKELALVPQNNIVFSGSIKEAIAFGRKVTMDEIVNAALIANAHEFINKLEKGYDTKLEERGTNLSGGQLQRISIARALIGNPAVLLLDEATSALDAQSEDAVKLGLRQAMKHRTVIVIAHRLSTVQEADQIIVLDQGEISEIGTHNDLISMKGPYSDLCSRQFIHQHEDP